MSRFLSGCCDEGDVLVCKFFFVVDILGVCLMIGGCRLVGLIEVIYRRRYS